MTGEHDAGGVSSPDRPFKIGRRQSGQLRKALIRRELAIEQQRISNQSIETLLSVVKYLNAVQDGDGLRIEGTYCRTDIDKPSRILNCHEEDIMNASLITMKRLITTLLPVTNQPTSMSTGLKEPAES